MNTHRRLLSLVLAASAAAPILSASSAAHADWSPVMHRSDAGADLYLWSARTYGSTVAAVPFVKFEATPDLFIDLQFPVGLSFDGPLDKSRAGLGNPTFTIFYADTDRKLTWYAGGRAALPMGLVHDYDWRWALNASSKAMGLVDPWLWAIDTLPFGGLGGIEYRFAHFFVLRAGGDLTFFPGVRSGYRRYINDYSDDNLGVSFQAKVEPEFQSRVGVGGGATLTSVVFPTARGDNAQVSLMPYFAYDSQKTFFMRAGALVALDRPLGPGFDGGRVATLYLQFGGHLD